MSADFFQYDFETMGTRADCIVIAIAMLCGEWNDYFPDVRWGIDPHNDDDMNVLRECYQKLREDTVVYKIETASQKEKGRTITESTLEFWKNNKEALKKVFQYANDIQAGDLYYTMRDYLASKDYHNRDTCIYIRAPHFDHGISVSMFDMYLPEDIKNSCPYSHWNVRDVRTIVDTAFGVKTGYPPEPLRQHLIEKLDVVKHDPRDDVALDIVLCYLSGERDRWVNLKNNR